MKSFFSLTQVRQAPWFRSVGWIFVPAPAATHPRFPFLLDPDDKEHIQVDGMIKFCQDIEVDPSYVVMVVLAWRFNAAQACVFTKKEFTEGMKSVG